MTAGSPQVAPPPARLRAAQRALSDNPAIALTFVFIALFVVTDIVNRAQSGKAFLTPTQVSTTFLYAAPLALLAAGQTLVMLTGGVDLSVATTATTAAFVTSGTVHDHGTGYALLLALAFGFGIGLVNGIGVAIFRVNPLIMTLGISSVTLGALTIYSQTRFVALVPNIVNTLGSSRFFKYVPYDLFVWTYPAPPMRKWPRSSSRKATARTRSRTQLWCVKGSMTRSRAFGSAAPSCSTLRCLGRSRCWRQAS